MLVYWTTIHVPGPRYVVQVGEKMIDFNESFRLFLSTRIPNPEIPPDAASIVTEVNFTTTRAGLTGQVSRSRPDVICQAGRSRSVVIGQTGRSIWVDRSGG